MPSQRKSSYRPTAILRDHHCSQAHLGSDMVFLYGRSLRHHHNLHHTVTLCIFPSDGGPRDHGIVAAEDLVLMRGVPTRHSQPLCLMAVVFHWASEEERGIWPSTVWSQSLALWNSFVMLVRAFKSELRLETGPHLKGMNHSGCVGSSTLTTVILYVMLKTPCLMNVCFLRWQEAGKAL